MAKYDQWNTEEGFIKIEGWAKDGLTNEQIANKMEINRITLYNWSLKNPKIAEALKKGKDMIDRKVENSLLKRALGYEYDETTTITDSEGNETTKVIRKHVIPDTTAQIFWLKNRKPTEWRDKREYKDNEALEKLDKILSKIPNKLEKGISKDV